MTLGSVGAGVVAGVVLLPAAACSFVTSNARAPAQPAPSAVETSQTGPESVSRAASQETPGSSGSLFGPGITPGAKASPSARETPSSKPGAKQVTTYSIDGRGPAVSQDLGLEKGLTTFYLNYQEHSPVVVELVNKQSGTVEQLVNATGPYDGTTASSLTAAGTYVVSIQGVASWSVVVSQPDVESEAGVRNASGSGDAVVYLALPSGASTLHFRNTGSAAFSSYLYNPTGQKKTLLEKKGPYDGVVSESVGNNGGVFAIGIRSDGDWSLEVQ